MIQLVATCKLTVPIFTTILKDIAKIEFSRSYVLKCHGKKRDVPESTHRGANLSETTPPLQREAERTGPTRQKPHDWESIRRSSHELAPRGLESRKVEASVCFQLP
jgi:hypothetical protein